MPLGIISKIYGAWYEILPLSNQRIAQRDATPLKARLRGRLRLKARDGQRHLICIGDYVRYTEDPNNPNTFAIESLEPRKNIIVRSHRKEAQGLGANLKRAVLVVSLCSPKPRSAFIDRFLTSSVAGGVSPILVFSKEDLYQADLDPFPAFLLRLYSELGFETYKSNLLEPRHPSNQRLVELLRQGASLLCGSSGTGKSTLLNLIVGEAAQATSEISQSTQKGRHTTTNSSLFLHPKGNGWIIDSPGVKEWGVEHLSVDEIHESYPELAQKSRECQFADCRHDPGSQGCAIRKYFLDSRKAFEQAEDDPIRTKQPWIHPIRYRSLQNMIHSLHDSRKIRTGDYTKATGRIRRGKKRPPEG